MSHSLTELQKQHETLLSERVLLTNEFESRKAECSRLEKVNSYFFSIIIESKCLQGHADESQRIEVLQRELSAALTDRDAAVAKTTGLERQLEAANNSVNVSYKFFSRYLSVK